jgi:hypothetical protein
MLSFELEYNTTKDKVSYTKAPQHQTSTLINNDADGCGFLDFWFVDDDGVGGNGTGRC